LILKNTPNIFFYYFSWSLSSSQLSNLGFVISSLPACANSKFQRSGKEHEWLWSQIWKSYWGTQRATALHLFFASSSRSL